MYLNPSCILQRENSPRSSVKVDSEPVKENTGSPASFQLSSTNGVSAAGLAVCLTPQPSLIRFPKLSISRETWNFCPATPMFCKTRRSRLVNQSFNNPFRSAILHRFSLRYLSYDINASSAAQSDEFVRLISLALLGI